MVSECLLGGPGLSWFASIHYSELGLETTKSFALPLQPRDDVTTRLLSIDGHNLLLTVWAETGLLGLGLLLVAHVLLARALFVRMRRGSVSAMGALISLAGFHILGMVHYLPYHSGVMLTFALVWGLGLAPVFGVNADQEHSS